MHSSLQKLYLFNLSNMLFFFFLYKYSPVNRQFHDLDSWKRFSINLNAGSFLWSQWKYIYDLKFGRNKMGMVNTMQGEVQDREGLWLGLLGDL